MSDRTPTRRSLRSRSGASGDARSEDMELQVSSPLVYGSPSDAGNRSQRLPNSEFDISSPLEYGTPSSIASVRTPRSSGIRGTPIRQRSDVRSNRHVRQVNLGSIPENAEPSSENNQRNAAPQLVVWGTDVVVNTCKEKFTKFVTSFMNTMIDEDERSKGLTEDRPFYLQKLEEIQNLEQPYLQLNCAHIQSYDGDLYRQLICYPQEVIPTFDMAVNELFFEQYPDGHLQYQIQVRPFNADKTKNMRQLNPEDIDQLISVSGMVIRVSNIIPEMREAFFRCSLCYHSVSVELDRGRIAEPTHCTNCNTKHAYTLVHNRSRFTDKQMVKIQESPDDRPAGQTPYTILMYAYNDLVDAVQPGDRVTVTGIYRAVPIKSNPRQRTLKAVYKTHVDIVHYRKIDTKRLHEHNDEKEIQLTPERIEQLKALSETPDVYDRLSRALAPSIFENQDIKKGILLQLFGGTKKDFEGTGKGKFRSDINILLCGDPGTSKSQLLQYVYNLVPRGQYTSGKGSSAVGLTAYVTKDPESKQLVLQTGALVLSDNGICCIDEFDKMNDSTRSVLHEVMEQQTLSIAKAGIICQLNARASILAAANPCESQWNKNKTIIENIQLPPTLLSRFDLIFLILDPQDEAFDRRLARHLVSLYYKSAEDEDVEFLDLSILKDYIAYARGSMHPRVSEEAGLNLIQAYVEMRKIGSGRGQVTAYPRQLESLIRLAEAHAKMRLSKTVEVIDVEEAIRIHREALKQSATDPSSGKIDVSILTTGLSSDARRRRAQMVETFKKMISDKGKVSTLPYQKTFSDLRELMDIQLTRDMFEELLQVLQDDGFLIVASRSTIRIC